MSERQARVITEIHAYPAVQAEWDVLPIEEQASLLESGVVIRGESWCEGGWLYTADPDAAKKAEAYDLELEPTKPRYWRKWRKARLRHRKVFRPMRQFNDVLQGFIEKHQDEIDRRRALRKAAEAQPFLVEEAVKTLKAPFSVVAELIGMKAGDLSKVIRGQLSLSAEQVKVLEQAIEATKVQN